jgi:hypothetical protein
MIDQHGQITRKKFEKSGTAACSRAELLEEIASNCKIHRLMLHLTSVSSRFVPLADIIRAMNQNRNIIGLSLDYGDSLAFDADIETATDDLSKSLLRKFSIKNTNLNLNGVAALFKALLATGTLQSLTIWECSLGTLELLVIGKFIEASKTITSIDLDSVVPRDFDWSSLRQSLIANYSLRQCWFNGVTHHENDFVRATMERNAQVCWANIHPLLVNVTIAMTSLNLPVYVILWIIDWLPHIHAAHTEYRKVRVIAGVADSIRRVYEARNSK